jgi:hypothetical protein
MPSIFQEHQPCWQVGTIAVERLVTSDPLPATCSYNKSLPCLVSVSGRVVESHSHMRARCIWVHLSEIDMMCKMSADVLGSGYGSRPPTYRTLSEPDPSQWGRSGLVATRGLSRFRSQCAKAPGSKGHSANPPNDWTGEVRV